MLNSAIYKTLGINIFARSSFWSVFQLSLFFLDKISFSFGIRCKNSKIPLLILSVTLNKVTFCNRILKEIYGYRLYNTRKKVNRNFLCCYCCCCCCARYKIHWFHSFTCFSKQSALMIHTILKWNLFFFCYEILFLPYCIFGDLYNLRWIYSVFFLLFRTMWKSDSIFTALDFQSLNKHLKYMRNLIFFLLWMFGFSNNIFYLFYFFYWCVVSISFEFIYLKNHCANLYW